MSLPPNTHRLQMSTVCVTEPPVCVKQTTQPMIGMGRTRDGVSIGTGEAQLGHDLESSAGSSGCRGFPKPAILARKFSVNKMLRGFNSLQTSTTRKR